MSSSGRGLHRLEGGARKRRREALEQLGRAPCSLRSCSTPSAALVQRWDGSFGFACAAHARRARLLGYRTFTREELEGE